MKRPQRFWRVLGVTGLLVSMLAIAVGPVTAQQDLPGDPAMDTLVSTAERSFRAGDNAIYYPWVANDDDFGLGPADTSISIQNLEDRDSQIWIYRGAGNDTWTFVTSAYLSAYASKTFSAADLGIAEREGAPVAVLAYNVTPSVATSALIETEVILSNPLADQPAGGDSTQVVVCVVNEHFTEGYGSPAPFMAAVTFDFDNVLYEAGDLVPWTDGAQLQEILNHVNAYSIDPLVNPFGGLNADGDCLDRVGTAGETGLLYDSVVIGGVAKAAVSGAALPQTSAADTAVSGYNSINGQEVARFNEWYLPIVQRNGGPGGLWNSIVRVANLGTANSAVEVRLFPYDDAQGSLDTGFQFQTLLDGGDVWELDLAEHVPEDWVGSAHIYSDGWVFAMVDRYKPGYSMWLTNTGSAANFENEAQVTGVGGRYALFAPHVLMGYFGWNTGLNVANLYDGDNNVSIQYFNMLGNATEVLNRRIAPHGMTYFYDSSQGGATGSASGGVVGSAIVWSEHPVAAAVDATKYPETAPAGSVDLFQGTTYSATQNMYTFQAVPLVQKGNPADGSGTTSGINVMNPNAEAATANVYWVDQSGMNASNFGVSSVTIPGYANGFVYSLWQHNLPNGFYGAAQVISNVPVAAVSANVNYEVDGDGSVIFNAFNPCGYYRTVGPEGNCDLGDPLDVSGRTVTKAWVDEDGAPVPGVQFHIVGQNPAFPYQRHGISGPDGVATFANVPVGEYELNVDSLPTGYQHPVTPADTFTLTAGEDWAATNVLVWGSGFHKTVCVAGPLDPDNPEVRTCSPENLRGVNVRVYEVVGYTTDGLPVTNNIVFDEETDWYGETSGVLGEGTYLLCMYDADGVVITTNDEQVDTYLPQEPTYDPETGLICGTYGPFELFTLAPGETVELFNPVFVRQEGVLDMFVGQGASPLAGVQVCIIQQYRIGPVYFEDDPRCLVTSDAGVVTFTNILNDEVLFYDFDIKPGFELPDDMRTLQQGTRVYTGYMWVGVNSASHDIYCAEGGEMTMYPNQEYLPCGPGPHDGDQSFYGRYVPNWDEVQDGFASDIAPDGTLIGTFDLTIDMRPR